MTVIEIPEDKSQLKPGEVSTNIIHGPGDIDDAYSPQADPRLPVRGYREPLTSKQLKELELRGSGS